MRPDLSVDVGGLTLQNPIMTASGTFGYGKEFSDFVDLDRLGAIVVKGVSLYPRPGNPPPRVVETACGMLNAIGLENGGLDTFLTEKIPYLNRLRCAVVVNILGDSVEEYCQLAERLSNESAIAAIEVNISCPNVKQGGVAFGTDATMVETVTKQVSRHSSKPVIIKLSPNVTDIVAMAKAAEQGGATAVSLINTLLGMAIDIHNRRPKLANVVGGLSGPAIKPVALRMVWQVARQVQIPVIGIGGIMNIEDVIEFLLAGASAVQIGTANLINPAISGNLVQELAYHLSHHGIADVRDLIGAVLT
ncbi:MAG: dihydroorotate dehydrogenase [Thermodesulfobacteriota bacterium]